jgi:hypothetical protein
MPEILYFHQLLQQVVVEDNQIELTALHNPAEVAAVVQDIKVAAVAVLVVEVEVHLHQVHTAIQILPEPLEFLVKVVAVETDIMVGLVVTAAAARE